LRLTKLAKRLYPIFDNIHKTGVEIHSERAAKKHRTTWNDSISTTMYLSLLVDPIEPYENWKTWGSYKGVVCSPTGYIALGQRTEGVNHSRGAYSSIGEVICRLSKMERKVMAM
jgi:hypothetical protein